MSPFQWLKDKNGLFQFPGSRTFGQQYADTIESFINNGSESLISPQVNSHAFHTKLGCNVLRTFTEFITPSLVNQQDPLRLHHIFQSSIYSAYHQMDQIANTPAGMFGGVEPVQIAATVGPLLIDSDDAQILRNEYEPILEILAPSLELLWIQNVDSLLQLQVIMDIAKDHLFDEQIWITINSEWMHDGGAELFNFLQSNNVGSIVVQCSDWKEINRNLVMVQSYTEIEGGTKFGVIVDQKQIRKRNMDIDGDGMGMIAEHVKEVDQKFVEKVGQGDGCTEWTDDLLERASKFWIEEGVSIIGCEWESGLRAVQKQAKEWNDSIGKRR